MHSGPTRKPLCGCVRASERGTRLLTNESTKASDGRSGQAVTASYVDSDVSDRGPGSGDGTAHRRSDSILLDWTL